MKLPQLSLRELFLLVVIAAMGCGWWVDHAHCADAYEDLWQRYNEANARAWGLEQQFKGSRERID